MAHALINLLITYEKYNLEAQDSYTEKTMKKEANMTSYATATGITQPGEITTNVSPFNEIELMKELVIEFG